MKSFIYENINIEEIEISVRLYNCLKQSNINTIAELIYINEDDLIKIRNLGKKSLEEIKDVINKLNNGEVIYKKIEVKEKSRVGMNDITLIELIKDKNCEISTIFFYNENNGYCKDLLIENLGFSVRTTNALINSGYKNISEIINLKIGKFNKIKNLGQKSRDEIINKLKKITSFTYREERYNNSYLEELVNSIVGEFELSLIEIDIISLTNRLAQNIRNIVINSDELDLNPNNFLQNKAFIKKLYNNDFFSILFKNHIAKFIDNKNEYVTLSEIMKYFPNHLSNNHFILNIIENMINKNIIEKIGDRYRIFYPSLELYIDSIKDEKDKIILRSRLMGKTLEEVGEILFITRERVRQKEVKIFKRIPRLREDDYSYSFEKYNWNKESFTYSYGVTLSVYNYLKYKYEKGNSNIKDILDDYNIQVKVRQKVEEYVYRDYLLIGNSRVKRDKQDMLDYILRNYCKYEVSVDELSDLYEMFLDDYDLLNDERFIFTKRYFESTLANSKRVLWKFRKKLRYYDLDDITAEKIVNFLNLDKLIDVEYSTLKLFNDYIDVMRDWDIRDEYELHNLMKKVIGDDNLYNIKFLRMPNIEFGNADRDIQVLELLIQTAPITNVDLAKVYESEYGVKAETSLANYFKGIDEYFHNGVYSIDYEALVGDEFIVMKEKLKEEIYSISEVKEIYKHYFPNGNTQIINPYNLKRLGFKVTSKLIYSDKYNNLDDYFNQIILKNEIYDANLLSNKITNSQSYYRVLQELKMNFEIVEFLPNVFINIKRLQNKGIYKENLIDYINYVYDFVDDEIFTIKSLRIRGLEHYLYELGLDDWFYSGLLRCNSKFKSRKVEGITLFRKGNDTVTINDLVEHIVSKYRKIDIYDLIDLLNEEYGVKIERYKITSIASEKELYYDAIMEKIYIDYNEYFEEV